MTDPNHEIDELLRAAARDYNRPGDTPRDRMWESIRAERARRAPVVRPARWRQFVLPVVAAAVLVVGVVIGRLYERMTVTHQPSVAQGTAPVVIDSPHLASPEVAPESSRILAAAPASVKPKSGRSSAPTAKNDVSAPSLPDSQNLTFRLAVVQHLAGTDALLTSFRDEAARGNVDAQITSWARKLLTTTRLLQAAAPQQDPTMKRLLDDLELVLIQIAQYSPTNPHRAEELELIEHSIQRRGVIGKLRTTIPARLAPRGT